MHWEQQGAFTGEISPPMLKELGCRVRHRRPLGAARLFGETDAHVARKVSALLGQAITPIVCVGESLEENREGRTCERVSEQIQVGLGEFSDAERAVLVIAYEPVWAIGTGLADSPESANETINMIRALPAG